MVTYDRNKHGWNKDWETDNLPDDYCEACKKQVANHETEAGILCDDCFAQVYGSPLECDQCGHPVSEHTVAEGCTHDRTIRADGIEIDGPCGCKILPVKEN